MNTWILVAWACWLKCWLAIEGLQVQAPLGTGFFSPMSILSSTPYHRILRWGRKAIGPGELVNISNLCYCSLLVKPHLVKSRIDGLNNR